jgi:ParB family transcriptional regulator, chromosome partitioning protein
MSKKKALGRGLSALLSDSEDEKSEVDITSPAATAPVRTSNLDEIPVGEIETNPFQPRQQFDKESLNELADSIKVHGIIQPITVRRLSDHQYQLISGERRFQASKIAGLKSLPAYVRTANDQQMLEMALIENIQRENLNPIEISLSYQRLISECNLKQEELGERVGKNRTTVTNYLRLLKLPPDVQIALRDNRISMGHARAIINIDDPGSQLFVFKKIVSDDLSVRAVESMARELTKGSKQTVKSHPPETHREINQLQSRLSSHFGTKVTVKSDGTKGDVRIPFYSVEDLNRIIDILKL